MYLLFPVGCKLNSDSKVWKCFLQCFTQKDNSRCTLLQVQAIEKWRITNKNMNLQRQEDKVHQYWCFY